MKGFTLIEFIIYIAIVAIILFVTVNFAWEIIYGNVKSQSIREVQQNARFAMEKITRTIQEAETINIPASGNSADFISLEMTDSNLDPTIFDLSDNKLRLSQGGAGPYELISNRVMVSNLRFTNLSYPNTPGTIRIEMTIDHLNPANRNEYTASLELASTASLIEGGAISASSDNCWGVGGSCDSACQYANYGSSMDYYTDPGCSDSCSLAGSFYINSSGDCSDDGTGSCYRMVNPSTGYASCNQGAECGIGCWGGSGSCDAVCQYSSYISTDYYADPGCSDSCPSVGSFYIPSDSCSDDGTGSCYKMTSPSTEYTSCFQGSDCAGECDGRCTRCRELDQTQCNQQDGCRWTGSRCRDRCTRCDNFTDKSSCQDQLGCSWTPTDWNWNLADQQTGYSSYDSCSWEVVEKWDWNLAGVQDGYDSYTACEWYAELSCQGSPTSCSGFGDETSCQNQSGCSWQGGCSGVCTSCDGLGFGDCFSQGGCGWNWPFGPCQGTCTSCDAYGDQGGCEGQLECSWTPPSCSGAATACENYSSEATCSSQDGCQWTTP